MIEQQPHTLDISGEGSFAVGSCSHPECGWELRGFRTSIENVFRDYHEEGSDLVLPPRVPVPPVPEHEYLQAVEMLILHHLVAHVQDGNERALFSALGLAYARAIWISQNNVDMTQPGWIGAPDSFVSVMVSKVKSLSSRQRNKLRHPQRKRADQQRILEGENT